MSMRISLSRGSAVYSIVMIIVLIGIVQNAVQDGLCSMTTIFILFEVGVFVIAAVLHP
jgi:chitin synthase